MTSFIIPFLVMFIIIYGLIHNVDVYDSFLDGTREGIELIFKIFPVMFAMNISINVLLKSNIINDMVYIFRPVLNIIGNAPELISLGLMRPISGTSSLIIMDDIFKVYSPDSFAGRVASVLQGSTDTTIYIISLYFSSIGIKKIKYSLLVGLLTDFAAIVISFLVVKMFFY